MIAQGWLLVSLALFAVGWALRMVSGLYATIWLAILALMVAKPF